MNELLLTGTTALAIAIAAATVVCIVRDRLPGRYLVGALAVLETALLVVAIVGLIQLATTDRAVDGPTLVGYLIAVLLLVPAAITWAYVERTRFGTAVIILACLAVPIMTTRAQQIWEAGHVG